MVAALVGNARRNATAFVEVRTGNDVMTCENCSRIVYYIEPATEQTGGGEGTRVTMS